MFSNLKFILKIRLTSPFGILKFHMSTKNCLGFRNLLWKLKAVNQFRNIVSGVLVTLRAALPGSSAKKVPVPEMLGNHTLLKEDLEVFHPK